MKYQRTLVNETVLDGWHQLLIEVSDDNDTNFHNLNCQFNHDPTTAELMAFAVNYGIIHFYDEVRQYPMALIDNVGLLVDFVKYIKTHPTITLTQYNTLLAAKPWYDAAAIRFFVYKLGVGLSEHKEIDLAAMTETEFLSKVRNWLVATAAEKIYKIVFGEAREL